MSSDDGHDQDAFVQQEQEQSVEELNGANDALQDDQQAGGGDETDNAAETEMEVRLEQVQEPVELQAVAGANNALVDNQAGGGDGASVDGAWSASDDEAETVASREDVDLEALLGAAQAELRLAEADGQRDDVLAARMLLKMHFLLHEAGRVGEAEATLAEARAMLDEGGERVPELEAQALRAEARALCAGGQPERAQQLCEEAVSLLQEHALELPGALAAANVDLAVALADQTRLEEAMQRVDEAMPALEEIMDMTEAVATARRAAVVAAKAQAAAGYVPRAIRILLTANDIEMYTPGRAEVLLELAKLYLRLELRKEAVAALDEARHLLSSVSGPHPCLVELAIVSSEVAMAGVGEMVEVADVADVADLDAALEELDQAAAVLLETYQDDLHPSVLRLRLARSVVMLRADPLPLGALDSVVVLLAKLGLKVEWPAGVPAPTPWTAPRRLAQRHVGVAVEMLRLFARSHASKSGGTLPWVVLAYRTALALLPEQSSLYVECLLEIAWLDVRYARISIGNSHNMARARASLQSALRAIDGQQDLESDWDSCSADVSLLHMRARWLLACVELYAVRFDPDGADVNATLVHFWEAVCQANRLPALLEPMLEEPQRAARVALYERAQLYGKAGRALMMLTGEASFERGMELLIREGKLYAEAERVGEQTYCLEVQACLLHGVGRLREAACLLSTVIEVDSAYLGAPMVTTQTRAVLLGRALLRAGDHEYATAKHLLSCVRDTTDSPSYRKHVCSILRGYGLGDDDG